MPRIYFIMTAGIRQFTRLWQAIFSLIDSAPPFPTAHAAKISYEKAVLCTAFSQYKTYFGKAIHK